MSKVFVVAPANLITGGPELCHQLVDMLNRDSKRASIVYYPFGEQHKIPDPYRRYNVNPAGVEDIEHGSTVVLPEVYSRLVASFHGSQVYFWWMSVGNFFHREGSEALVQLDVLRRHVTRHLYQSDYARTFLQSQSLGPASRLSDYLAPEYVEAISAPPGIPREDIVVYNPVKGSERTRLLVSELNKRINWASRVFAVNGMDRDQIRQVLGRAKVYIDFGGHPGKDRLPREAAAMGACVLTNRRGSASNQLDVPIPRDYKIDDRKPGFQRRAANKINTLITNFDKHVAVFDAYRAMIAAEPHEFMADVETVFGTGPSRDA